MIWSIPFLAVVGFLLPFLAWSSHRHLSAESEAPAALPSADALAAQTIVVQVIVIALAWLALLRRDLSPSFASRIDATTLLGTCALVLAALKAAQLEARRLLGPSERLRRELRSAGLTTMWFLAICAAAIGEEYAYRGVLFVLIGESLSPFFAALASALLFGLAHVGQGWRGATMSAGFGLGLQAIVVLSGGLSLAILAHLLYDLGVVWLGRRLAHVQRQAPV